MERGKIATCYHASFAINPTSVPPSLSLLLLSLPLPLPLLPPPPPPPQIDRLLPRTELLPLQRRRELQRRRAPPTHEFPEGVGPRPQPSLADGSRPRQVAALRRTRRSRLDHSGDPVETLRFTVGPVDLSKAIFTRIRPRSSAYMTLCPSVDPSVGPLDGPSVPFVGGLF